MVNSIKEFEMTHILGQVITFSEHNASDYLTSENTFKGSTIDMRWFWKDHVLTLKVGDSVETDFSTIKRIK